MRENRRPLAHSLLTTLLAVTSAGLLLTACGSSSTDAQVQVAATTPAPVGAAALSITDPWVKTAEKGMTATFGIFENTGAAPITIVSAKTSASSRTELHEVAKTNGAMVMQPKQGGFTVPAGGKLELAPGGLHIMIMDLVKPVKAGDEVSVRLTLSDGTTSDFTALAKATTAGEEKYKSDAGMDMSTDAAKP